MKKLLSLLKNKWVLALLGLIAIGILLWFVGPLISIGGSSPFASDLARWGGLALIGGTMGIYRLKQTVDQIRYNKQLLGDLVGQVPAGGGGTAGGGQGTEQDQATQQAVKQGAKVAASEEASTLKKDLNEALAVLKKAKLGGDSGGRFSKQYLYQIPWYIFIGPPGSGKTTALVHSGLNFPLAKHFGKNKIKGVGGTRNCDWWFTDEAVMLDTAGRYTTQDSQKDVDQAAWDSFLGLLKKHRKRRPINGAFIAISLADLLQLNEEQLAEQAQAIKNRIQELHERMGIRFPIYVFFTKSDLLAGFVEFFTDLGRGDRGQVWGVTFPLDDPRDPDGVVARFKVEFDLLEQRLSARLIDRLQEERDPERRNLIYAFPQQFRSYRASIDQFLQEVFRPNRFDERPLLRGVYFTSGTQEGTPIDRLMGAMASGFGLNRTTLNRFAGKGRSYFIQHLFREVIFPEAELAGMDQRWERIRAWLQKGAYAGAILLAGLIATAWVTSCTRNQLYISNVEDHRKVVEELAKKLDANDDRLVSTLPVLNAARAIPSGYADRKKSTPLLMGFGLYQGDKLGFQAQMAYRRLLDRAYLPRLILYIEQRLRKEQDPDKRFDVLEVYRMLYEPAHFKAATIQNWVEQDWQKGLPSQIGKTQRKELQQHLQALLEPGHVTPPIDLPPDQTLIDQSSEQLRKTSTPSKRLYRYLRNQGYGKVKDFDISQALDTNALQVFERKNGQALSTRVAIPGLFTHAGYHSYLTLEGPRIIKTMAASEWVLGEGEAYWQEASSQQHLKKIVCGYYLRDYATQWLTMMGDIRIQAFSDPQDATGLLRILASYESPLAKLVKTVEQQTALDRDPEPPATPAVESKKKSKDTAKLTLKPPTIEPPRMECELGAFTQKFANLRHEVEAQEGAPSPMGKTLATLEKLHQQMNAVVRAAERGKVSQDLKDDLQNIANLLEVEAEYKPVPLNEILINLAKASANASLGLRERLNALWRAAAIPTFYSRLKGRYPLSRSAINWSGSTLAPSITAARGIEWSGPNSGSSASGNNKNKGPQDMSLADFGRFFGPNGLLDGFFRKHLKSYVDTSQSTWSWRADQRPEEAISKEALRAFQQAANIRKALFQENNTPLVQFQLTPIAASGKINQFRLTINGQTLVYQPGQKSQASEVAWPGSFDSEQASFKFFVASGSQLQQKEKGTWAWFRLLDQADVRARSEPGSFRVSFEKGGHKVHYKLTVQGALNPFQLRDLEAFRCPQTL